MATTNQHAGKHCLAIQTNTDGRPCGWGLAPTEDKAREVAEAMWCRHGAVIGVDAVGADVRSGHCYEGEERGPVEIKWVDTVNEAARAVLPTTTQDNIRRGISRFMPKVSK